MIEMRVGDCRDVLATMAAGSVNCAVTSPPYFGLRDYGINGQIGLEPTPDEYVAELVAVFREVRRVLRDDGTLWLNLGDSYASTGGHTAQGSNSQRAGRANVGVQNARKGFAGGGGIKIKDLIGIPWRVAFALQADGWYLRQDIIWHKPNPMPESVKDRCTKAHEYMFLLTKSARYYFDAEAIKEPEACGRMRGPALHADTKSINGNGGLSRRGSTGFRNKRSVWTIQTKPLPDAHFATFPPALIEPCILAGCPKGGMVLDPFGGAGTVGLVCDRLGRDVVLIELNPEYVAIARKRISATEADP